MHRNLALIIGFAYTTFVGKFSLPYGLQSTALAIAMLASLSLFIKREGSKFTRSQALRLTLGIIISLTFAFNTNTLVLNVSSFAVLCIVFAFLLELRGYSNAPDSGLQHTSCVFQLIRNSCLHAYKMQTLVKYLDFKEATRSKLSGDTKIGLLLSLPLLLVFHFLFVSINQEYLSFTNKILSAIIDFLYYLWQLDFVAIVVFGLIYSYILYSFFTAPLKEKENTTDYLGLIFDRNGVTKVVLFALVILFAIFIPFQAKLLFLDIPSLAYKQFSLYTQKGFWELLGVSAFGYCLLLLAQRKKSDNTSGVKTIRILLIGYCAQLLAVSLFSYHKLHYLQLLFGLRDRRVFATCAVVLITFTFIMHFFRIFEKVSEAKIFSIQSIAFLVLVAVLSVVNLESAITKYHPLTYYHEGTRYKDYSYLLTNSYDNYDSWLDLIEEAKRRGMPEPKNYYWGKFVSVCGRNDNTKHRMQELPIKTHILYLHNKYSQFGKKLDLRAISSFNFREYQAYLHVEQHMPEINQFIRLAERTCGVQ